jgi:DNA mismatch repair protein MutS
MAVVKECLENNIKWQNEYGPKTIVLTAIGSFAENYSLENNDGSYTSSVFQEFITICDLAVGKKITFIDGKQLVMAGFGLTQIDKYVRKLQEHDYTIVIYKQDVNGKNTTRSLAEIISPGTYFGQETQELSNNIMAIWLDKSSNGRGKITSKYFRNSSGGASSLPSTASEIAIGVANIDIFTGKTSLFQFSVEYNHNPLTYDELERYVSAYKPSECLLIFNIEDHVVNDIISFVGLDTCRKIHKVNLAQQTLAQQTLAQQTLAQQTLAQQTLAQQTLAQQVQVQSTMIKCALNAEKQKYQKEVLTRFYPAMSDTFFMDSLSTHFIATQAFCFLLDFVYQHSPNLVSKLSIPVYENRTDKLVLANHSLTQLNIIDDSRHTGKHRSVCSLLNNCVTTMGKRSFIYTLNNPSTNSVALNESYDITEHMLSVSAANQIVSGATANHTWQTIRKDLSSIKDMEKFGRKLVMGKITPKDFALLVNDLRIISDLYTKLKGDTVLGAYIGLHSFTQNSDSVSESTLCAEIIADLTKTFILDICAKIQNTESDQLVFVNKGISSTIDTLSVDSVESRDKLEAIRTYFSDIVKIKEKKASKEKEKETEYIKLHETAKSDAVLMGTSRRVMLLKSELKKKTATSVEVKYTTKQMTFDLYIEDLSYESVGMNTTISNSQIKQISSSVQNSKDKLIEELLIFFNNYVGYFAERFDRHLEQIKNYITLLDVLQCKCYIAHTYNYCKPTMGALPSVALAPQPPYVKQEGNFLPPTASGIAPYIKFTGIRHPLIEHIQTNELYVTNDLHIGGSVHPLHLPSPPYASSLKINSPEGLRGQGQVQRMGSAPSGIAGGIASGILLFGTNAVGKTSFIKSVGIALIMAQAGLYVPCTTFEYKPYSYIFTRILGNDNLFKGLSTFAVEMSELRTILLQADENSLVLGDELCSGTESDSALSIFTAGLEHLHKKQSTFLFATHFHEIVKFEEIKALDRLTMKHMAVKYDVENGVLIYDRKLQDGAGESNYGIQVCRSLHLPDEFLNRADEIRMKYNKSKQNMLALGTSHFNAQKVVGNCELCKTEKASEVHHLQHQSNANKSNNYIDTFHKNHPANLVNICETCHKKIHGTDKQHKVVKSLNGTFILMAI